MSISVQQLVQTAFQNCSLIGDGESVDGTMAGTTANEGALGLLNNLLLFFYLNLPFKPLEPFEPLKLDKIFDSNI